MEAPMATTTEEGIDSMTYEEIQSRVERWARSPEGKQNLAEALKRADKANKDADRARQVDQQHLLEPFTL